MTEHSAPQPEPIAGVQVGMSVIDVNGEPVGEVEDVKLGDPSAVTAEGQRMTDDRWKPLAEAFAGSEPKVPRQWAEQLLRTGYIKIDPGFLAGKDRYVSADQVSGVTDGQVRLGVPRDGITPRA